MRRRTFLGGVVSGTFAGIAGCTETIEDVPVPSKLDHNQDPVSIFGQFPQIAIQSDAESKYNGISWFDSDGSRIANLAADIPDQELSLYATSPSGMRKALDIHYGLDALTLNFKNTRSLFVSGGDDSTGDTIIGIEAGKPGGDSILRLVNDENQSVWGLFRDGSSDEDFRLYNYRASETALTVSASENSVDFNGNPSVGLREIEDPVPDDLAFREWAWDATDDRWLYRNDSGAVHYFEPDGTL